MEKEDYRLANFYWSWIVGNSTEKSDYPASTENIISTLSMPGFTQYFLTILHPRDLSIADMLDICSVGT